MSPTGADGRAAICGLHTGRWRVVVEAPGFARAEFSTAWVTGDPPREVLVTLERANALDVTVRDSDDHPVAGVGVAVAAPGTRLSAVAWTQIWRATTDVGGGCRLNGLPRGTLVAWCEGGKRDSGVFVRVPSVNRVELLAPPSATDLECAKATLDVRVVDSYGGPVRGADVRFIQGRIPFAHLTAQGTTGDDGVCRATAIADLLACVERIEVRRAGSATARVEMSLVQTGGGESHHFDDIVLHPEARISGKVLGPEGPVPDAEVAVWVKVPGHFGEMEAEETKTEADGTYHVGGLAAGAVVVIADAPGLDPAGADNYGNIAGSFGPRSSELDRIPESVKATLSGGVDTTLDLRMVRTGPAVPVRATFSGVVVRDDGSPVPWADVWAGGSADHRWVRDAGRTVSRADGRFRLEAMAAEGFDLHAAVNGWASERVPIEMKESGARDGIQIVVKALPLVRGIVRSSLGLPVVGARVQIGVHHAHKFSEGTHWSDHPPGIVTADGTFELPADLGPRGGDDHDSPLQEYVVCVQAEGHGPKITAPFTPEDVAAKKLLEVVLDAGVAIDGRVVGDSGAPVADAAITLVQVGGGYNDDNWPPKYPPMPGEALVARSAQDGTFRVANLFPSAYAVHAAVRGTVGASADATPPTKLVLHARSALGLAGRVVTNRGEPVSAYIRIVALEEQSSEGLDCTTDEAGAFRFKAVPSGRWRMEIESGDEDLQPLVVESVVAGTTDLRIQLKSGLRIVGSLLDAQHRPVARAALECHRGDGGPGSRREVKTDDDGKFNVPGLLPVSYEVVAEDLGLRWPAIEAGATVSLRVPGDRSVAGRIRLPDGGWTYVTLLARPVGVAQGAAVVVVHECRTKEGGTFLFEHLAPGRYLVDIEDGETQEDGHPFRVSIPAGTTIEAGVNDVVLDLERHEIEPPVEKR